MLQKLLNFLRGSVLVAVECSAPERIINLCAVHDIPFWDVTWRDATHFALRTTRWGFVRLRAVSDQVAATLTVRREKGAPVVLRRFRRLPGSLREANALARGSDFVRRCLPEAVIAAYCER